jgi:hypothetical protein
MSKQANSRKRATEATDQFRSNDESGDLSQWQYLTERYDDEKLFAIDVDSIRPSDRSMGQYQRDVTIPLDDAGTSPLNQHRGTHQELTEANYGSTEVIITNSSSAPDLLLNSQLIQQAHRTASMSSFHAEIQPKDQVNTSFDAWSYPTSQNAGLRPDDITTSAWLHNYAPSSSLTNQFWTAPYRRSSGMNTKHQLLPGLFEATEPNQFNLHYPHDHSMTKEQQLASLHSFVETGASHEEFVAFQRASRSNLLEPTPINPLLSLINRVGSDIDFTQNIDTELVSTWTTSEDSKPQAKSSYPKSMQQASNSKSIETTSRATATIKAEAIPTSFPVGSVPSAAVPYTYIPYFTLVEQQQIYSWMTLSPGPLPLPPCAQFRKKALLLKPLTAYNYYYRDERLNIVSQVSLDTDPIPHPVCNFSAHKLQYLLYERWYVDPVKKKRRHRKSHGKINFLRLSKVISERWHQLSPRGRDFYRAVAQYDTIHYHQHVRIIQRRPDII